MPTPVMMMGSRTSCGGTCCTPAMMPAICPAALFDAGVCAGLDGPAALVSEAAAVGLGALLASAGSCFASKHLTALHLERSQDIRQIKVSDIHCRQQFKSICTRMPSSLPWMIVLNVMSLLCLLLAICSAHYKMCWPGMFPHDACMKAADRAQNLPCMVIASTCAENFIAQPDGLPIVC